MVSAGKTEWKVWHYFLHQQCCTALHHFCVTVSCTSPKWNKKGEIIKLQPLGNSEMQNM